MKRLALILALLIPAMVNSQTCLPEGITFETQAQVDSFQTDFPGCTEIEGDVSIYFTWGTDITNLNELNVLTSIWGDLRIEKNPELVSLMGLDNLISIGNTLRIDTNTILTNLTSLENLTSIGNSLQVSRNPSLETLTGLDNIEAMSINHLIIFRNNQLTNCEVQSVCDYLVNPNGELEIFENAPGCNSVGEVEQACETVSVNELSISGDILNTPNPFSTSTTIKYELSHPETVRITFYNQFGKQVDIIRQNQSQGLQEVVWTPENLVIGVYYFRLEAGDKIASGKVVLMR